MAISSIVFFKTVSVFLSVIIGFLAGRYFNVERDSIASLLFYFVSPVVFFSIPASVPISFAEISISIVTFIIASGLCLLAYYISGIYWQDRTRNVIALSAGTANTGYFMMPIAAALFDDTTLSMYMMAIVGTSIYEATVGFYICARSFGTVRESIMEVLKLPILNAFLLGCLFSFAGLSFPAFLDGFVDDMKAAFSILGMIMVGLGLADLRKFEIDPKFTLATFIAKFLFYPLAINVFIVFDRFVTQWYNESHYNALQLLSIAPMASNIIVISSLQKFYPERVAATVLLSLLFALIYMPIMASLFLSDLN